MGDTELLSGRLVVISFDISIAVASLRRTSESMSSRSHGNLGAMATTSGALISILVSVQSRVAPAVHGRRERGAPAVLTAGNRGYEGLIWSAGCGAELSNASFLASLFVYINSALF